MPIYIGTYIENAQESVYVLGERGEIATIKGGPNPSFLCFNSSRSCLYVANELEKPAHGTFGEIRCFMRDAQNWYVEHSRGTSGGDAPCHIALCEKERLLFACNYGSGTLCVYRLDPDGGLQGPPEQYLFCSVHRERQESPHPHQALLTLCGLYLLVCDLGCDCIYVFALRPEQTGGNTKRMELLHRVPTPSGFGPRHMAFSDCGAYLYVLGELSSSIITYAYKSGTLQFIEELPVLQTANPENAAAEIVCYRKKIYVSVRGDDSISVFAICDNGTLKHKGKIVCGGKTPRSFAIFTPDTLGASAGLEETGEGLLVVANQGSDNISCFALKEGMPAKLPLSFTVPSPAVVI